MKVPYSSYYVSIMDSTIVYISCILFQAPITTPQGSLYKDIADCTESYAQNPTQLPALLRTEALTTIALQSGKRN